jgi:hypothetical protein
MPAERDALGQEAHTEIRQALDRSKIGRDPSYAKAGA